MPDIESIGRESRRVIQGTAGWAPARWRLTVEGGSASRAVVMHGLVQTIADLAADAEGRPRRPVPVPEHDTGLCDQLAVMVADLIAAEPDSGRCDAAVAAIRDARSGLFAG